MIREQVHGFERGGTQAEGRRHMSPGWGRILRVGLTAGLLASVPTAWLVWKILFRQEQDLE
jgi:hypothetical protein